MIVRIVGGIKVCQKAGRLAGRTWQGGKAKLRDTLVGSPLVVYLCVLSVSGLSLIVARDNPFGHKG
jgi:hypothetical protein